MPTVINRQTITAAPDGFAITSNEQVAAFEQTVAPTLAVGRDVELVRRSVTPAALCFRWDNLWLSAAPEPDEPAALAEPSAELQTIRLALIHLTGQWIEPTDHMNAEMAAVVTDYQAARGLAVDGSIGDQTTRALVSRPRLPGSGFVHDGHAGGVRSAQVHIGRRPARRRRVASPPAVAAASDRSTSCSPTRSWDGRNAMFLGCYRWQAPPTGLSCSWSGTTPLQLVGLVDDPAAPGLGTFSILYARSTAV